MLLENKIALVTGASRGIGQACALALSQEGAKVMGTSTSAAGASAITETLSKFQGKGFLLDVTEKNAIENLIDSVVQTYGKLDILVNNAGITCDRLLMRLKEDEWDSVLNTNLKAAFLASQAALKSMLKIRQGRIIHISSIVGLTGNAGQSNYAASKAGLIGLTKSLAKEVGSRGITVNTIAPGFINTDMTATLKEEQKLALVKNIVLERFGEPMDIAHMVVFLASEKAAYITGQTLHINGGMLMP